MQRETIVLIGLILPLKACSSSFSVKDGVFLDAFVTEQLKLGNLPTRGLHVTCNSVNVTFSFADHAFGRNDDGAMERKVKLHCSCMYQVSQKRMFTHLSGCEIKGTRLIFKDGMLIYQSKANFDEIILFDKITHYLDPEIRKMLARGMFKSKDSSFHSGSIIYLLLKLKFYS